MKALSRYTNVAKKKFYANGDTYVGTLRDDKRHGKGTMTYYSSASHYYGDWVDDKRVGVGIIKYSDGSSYEGEFRNDMCNGRGVFRWTNGDAFDGYWCNDKRNGSGKYIFADGNFYEGVWHEGAAATDTSSIFRCATICMIRLGRPLTLVHDRTVPPNHPALTLTLRFQNGESYEGEWKNQMRHGRGIHKWVNGETYSGEWKNNKR